MKNWDKYFLNLAKCVSLASKDPSTKFGCIIVRPDKTIASTGYNGFPIKMEDKEEYLNNRDEKYSRILHAEINALLTLRERPVGYSIYIYPFISCDRCTVQIIQSGITRVISCVSKNKRWENSIAKSLAYYKECNVEVTLL